MNFVITGGASGLGQELGLYLVGDHDVRVWDTTNGIDVTDYTAVNAAAEKLGKVDVLVNCAGVNYIDWIEDLHPHDFSRVMAVNCNGILHCTQALLPKLRNGGTVCNILSNAAHVPMTASAAYNASKAAATMLTRQMAHELGPRHGITVFGISPNKLAGTSMSKYTAERVSAVRGWSPDKVQRYQSEALPARKETPVEIVAEFIAFLLMKKERHQYLQGCIIPYGGP